MLTDIDPVTGNSTVRAWVNPLVAWIWLGGVVMAVGMVVILTGRPPVGPPEPRPTAERRRRVAIPA